MSHSALTIHIVTDSNDSEQIERLERRLAYFLAHDSEIIENFGTDALDGQDEAAITEIAVSRNGIDLAAWIDERI